MNSNIFSNTCSDFISDLSDSQSSTSDTSNNNEIKTVEVSLRRWYNNNSVTHKSLNEILDIFRQNGFSHFFNLCPYWYIAVDIAPITTN